MTQVPVRSRCKVDVFSAPKKHTARDLTRRANLSGSLTGQRRWTMPVVVEDDEFPLASLDHLVSSCSFLPDEGWCDSFRATEHPVQAVFLHLASHITNMHPLLPLDVHPLSTTQSLGTMCLSSMVSISRPRGALARAPSQVSNFAPTERRYEAPKHPSSIPQHGGLAETALVSWPVRS